MQGDLDAATLQFQTHMRHFRDMVSDTSLVGDARCCVEVAVTRVTVLTLCACTGVAAGVPALAVGPERLRCVCTAAAGECRA
jgi:hypothetical protein